MNINDLERYPFDKLEPAAIAEELRKKDPKTYSDDDALWACICGLWVPREKISKPLLAVMLSRASSWESKELLEYYSSFPEIEEAVDYWISNYIRKWKAEYLELNSGDYAYYIREKAVMRLYKDMLELIENNMCPVTWNNVRKLFDEGGLTYSLNWEYANTAVNILAIILDEPIPYDIQELLDDSEPARKEA